MRAGSSLVPTCGSTGLGGFTSTTVRGIAKLMSTKSIWRRDRALLTDRWERHGFTSKHLRRDGATIIADADRLLGRAWNPRRLAAWQGLLDNSLLGRAGRARAYRNWRRAITETGQPQQGNGSNLGGA
jgi:hypothetical protein